MKLSEIVLIPSRDQNIQEFEKEFDFLNSSKGFGSLKFVETKYNTEHHLGLVSGDNLISYLRLDIRIDNMWQISYAQTELDYRGQGCFRFLILKAVNDHKKILSDTNQTEESKSAWKSLIKLPGGTIKIFLYDINTKELSPTLGTAENHIWGDSANPLLMITESQLTSQVKEVLDRDEEFKEKIQRDHDTIWFGPESSNKKYINP